MRQRQIRCNTSSFTTHFLVAVALCLLAIPGSTLAQTVVPESFADLAEEYGPTVVNIYSTQTIESRNLPYNYFFDNEQMPELFKHFFDLPNSPKRRQPLPSQKRTSLGSGVITSNDGYILTNNHVVEDADEINVRLSNFEEYSAKIIGRDPKTDLALIKIDPKHELPHAKFGDSDKLRVGDWVVAIGNPFGFDHTVTAGIVSGKGRTLGSGAYQNFIQTDASINPGNSGGPLFNMNGELMGINTAIYSKSGGNIGLGFAIPSNMAKSVVDQLKGSGKVTRGMLGVMIQPVSKDLAAQFDLERAIGALVGQVMQDSPAAKAGIKPGDIILEYQGREIVQMSMLPAMVAQTPVGTKAIITLYRNGDKQDIEVEIGKLPDDNTAVSGAPEQKQYQDDFGFTVQEVTSELARTMKLDVVNGLVVTNVSPGSIAAQAGLQIGDLILEAGTGQERHKIETIKEFEKIVTGDHQKNILLLIKNNKQSRFVLLKRADIN